MIVPRIDFFLDARPPYVITDVDGCEIEVENALGEQGFTVGDSWWASPPEHRQSDGRWKLFVEDLSAHLYDTREYP